MALWYLRSGKLYSLSKDLYGNRWWHLRDVSLKIPGGIIAHTGEKWMHLETDTYLDADRGRVADENGPASWKMDLRGWWCVVQRRLLRFCEGEPSAARLYKPARLCDSRTPSHPMHVPTPGTLVPTPSPIHRQSILVQSNVPVYLGHGVPPLLLSPEATRPPSNPNANLAAKCRRRGSLRFLGMGVFHRCLPLKTSARGKSSLDRLSDWRRFAGRAPVERQMDPIVRRRGDRYFFFCTQHYARRAKKVPLVLDIFRLQEEKKEKIAAHNNDDTRNLSLLSRRKLCELLYFFNIFFLATK